MKYSDYIKLIDSLGFTFTTPIYAEKTLIPIMFLNLILLFLMKIVKQI